jgi:ribosome biogenesis protein BRX1
VPRTSRRLKPFIDHILLFSILDNKIWFRNYQVSLRDRGVLSHVVDLRLSHHLSSAPLRSVLTPAQIIEKDPLHPTGPPQTSLVEIGPRFVLTPIRIFEGSFGGPTLFSNPEFVSPAAVRASIKREAGQKYRVRKEGEAEREERRKRQREGVPEDDLARKRVFA